MKRFHFPLRPVAVLRAHRETRAQEIFATSVHALTRAQEELNRTRIRVRALEGALSAGRQERFHPAEAALLLVDYRRECTCEVASERAVITARDEMHKRRAEYIEAHRQLEIVERLEEKARAAHRRENDRAEQAEADDFAGRRRGESFAITL